MSTNPDAAFLRSEARKIAAAYRRDAIAQRRFEPMRCGWSPDSLETLYARTLARVASGWSHLDRVSTSPEFACTG